MRLLIIAVILSLLFSLLLTACSNATPDTAPVIEIESESLGDPVVVTDGQMNVDVELERLGVYALPAPVTDGDMSVEAALASRRSRRDFSGSPLTMEQLSQLLWAAYGVTEPRPEPRLRGGLRTTPSAGALYALEVYAIVGNMDGLDPGVYRYDSEEHKLIKIIDGDIRLELMEAALGQRMVSNAPVTIFYSAVFDRMTGVYGERGILYAYIELGHSAQNVYLQAEALGLGTVAIGAFIDDRVRELLGLPDDETPLYLMPVGLVF